MITSVFFIILFVLLFIVFYPLFNQYESENIIDNNNAKEMYKINLLQQIKEIDFEKEMGILSNEDYKFIKNNLLLEISNLFKK